MRKMGYFTGFYMNIDKQARAMYRSLCVDKNSQFVSDDISIDSVEYRRQAGELLHKFNQESSKPVSIKEYFSKSFDTPWKDEMQYVNMAFNIFLTDEMGLSQEQVKDYFRSKTLPEISQQYYQNFRTFFVKQKLLTLGDIITREQLENRIKRTKLNLDKLASSGVVMSDYRVECQNNLDAYNTVFEFMRYKKIDEVDLFALFNAHNLTLYVPKGERFNPKDRLVTTYSIDESFVLEDDVVSRDG